MSQCRSSDASPTRAQGHPEPRNTALSLQIIPRFTLSLGKSNVSHHSPLFPGWRQGQQPKGQSSSTVMSPSQPQ